MLWLYVLRFAFCTMHASLRQLCCTLTLIKPPAVAGHDLCIHLRTWHMCGLTHVVKCFDGCRWGQSYDRYVCIMKEVE